MAEREGMSMTALDSDLTVLGRAIAMPTVSADFADRVQARLEGERPPGLSWRQQFAQLMWGAQGPAAARPLRRALVLSIVLLLVIAAIATAIGLGVPGIRIVFGPGPSVPPSANAPSPSAQRGSVPPGATLGLGTLTPFDEVAAATGFTPRLPAGLGAPVASYVNDRRLEMVWPPSPAHPAIEGTSVGLVVTEFQGRIDQGYYEKVLQGGTEVEAVKVGGNQGYWLYGEPHLLFYIDPDGHSIDEHRLTVGKVLIWADADLTYRVETTLSRDQAIRLAESLR